LFLLSFQLTAEEPDVLSVVSDIWPPFVTDNANMPGVDVEVMKTVFSQLNIDVNFTVFPWKRSVSMVELGQADALLDVFKTQERLSLFWFAEEPISTTETALFCVYCDHAIVVDENQLKGKTLIINRGYQYSRFGNDPNIEKFEVNSFEQGFKMLTTARADYYLVNRTVGQYTLNQLQLPNVTALDMKIDDPSDVYLAFHKAAELEPISLKFSEQLKLFKKTSEYRAILAKYGILH